ncbi:glycosyltransferase family 4 protein [Pararhizobium antarcticum]|uniref:Glycosyl transferase n=1 Tax=Pararhizobium antarcticum TaxID=1798805 RepID=A0A657LTA3_9HYPH|nr:glycosyltransferase family 4 protein [Pararhizobium antarcticum]OJF96222.1 glycosyl transferase [Rhizobium sp. 58]OJF97765.1 glycosyl transferase [Pararhizobium antarcticum]
MKNRLVFAYPGQLELKTGGYGYDRRLIRELEILGWQVEFAGLGDGFPVPRADVLAEAEGRLSALPDGALVMIDGLAFGAMNQWAKREASRLRIVALVHHPLALETGTPADLAGVLRASEREALRFVRHVVVTSPETARTLSSSYGVASADITIALPGTDQRTLAAGGNDPVHIVSVGTLTKRKGHDVLINALHTLKHLPWRASIIGNRSLDPATAGALDDQIRRLGLGERVTLCGEVSDVPAKLETADIFALASRYEGYGMVFAEALAQGLPIVACHAGAVPDVVPPQAGILVAVDDVDAFAGALREFIINPRLRRQFADAAAEVGAALPGWRDTAASVAVCLKGIQ